MARRALWFVAVGCAAASLHWLLVVAFVESLGWPPLGANALAWLLAFGLSFSGHHLLSFRGHGVPAGRSAQRFFAVSAAGFVVNQLSYAVLLRWGGLGYRAALLAVLLGVALATWWLSRHWAFRRRPGAR